MNSSEFRRKIESVTPKGDLSWYIKWIASVFVLVAMSIRGVEEYIMYDLYLSTIGISLWLIVSVLWRDRALIMLNGAGLLFLIRNIFQNLL